MDLSDIEGSTVPNTPEDFSDVTILKEDDAFALLRPVSPTAQNGFNASVNAVIMTAGRNPAFEHYRQFIHAERGTARASSVFTEDESSDIENPEANPASHRWNGAFKFSLREPSRDQNIGWYLGTSRGHSLSQTQGIDILLAPPISIWKNCGIAGNHARLYFHKESYRMVLQARHTVTVGKSERTIRKSQVQVLDDKDLVIIGDFTYAFEYTDHFRSMKFEAELSQYVQQIYGPRWAINKVLSPASVGAPVPLGEYYRSPNSFAQGTFGQIAAGWTRDGAAVAIKQFQNSKKSDIESHKELMQIIGSHENVLCLLDCIANFSTPVSTAHCIYSPLAAMTLGDLINSYETNSAAQIALLKDYLAGLSYLHGKGIMHRDIKPQNLAVRSIQDPKGVILDLDAATLSQTSKDHMQGTIPYLAPEIIALKDWSSLRVGAPPPYNKSVDVWALGLSIFALLARRNWSWKYFSVNDSYTPDRYTDTRYSLFRRHIEQLREYAEEPGPNHDQTRVIVIRILLDMTEERAENRLLASQLLQNAQTAANSMNVDISITPKQGGKHKRADENENVAMKRQHIR